MCYVTITTHIQTHLETYLRHERKKNRILQEACVFYLYLPLRKVGTKCGHF